MSSGNPYSALFVVCRELNEQIESFMHSVDIPNFSKEQLVQTHKKAIKFRNEFEQAIRDAEHIKDALALGHDFMAAHGKADKFPKVYLLEWTFKLAKICGDTLRSLHAFEREIRYAKEGKELFPLPPISTDSAEFQILRNNVVARIIWLLDRQALHESTFPDRGRDRYAEGHWCVEPPAQVRHLPQALKWLVDTSQGITLPVSTEWEAVATLVGRTTCQEADALHRMRDFLISTGNTPVNAMHRVELFTRPASAEAVAAGCTSCPICSSDFSDIAGDNNEPAVKTICGHFIGKRCLQAWADTFTTAGKEDDTNCPNCRTHLLIGQFPLDMQAAIFEYVAFLRNDPALDQQVDEFLLNFEAEKCYGPELGIMLAKLDQRANETQSLVYRLTGRTC